jgi:exodeoxyribonuclease-3
LAHDLAWTKELERGRHPGCGVDPVGTRRGLPGDPDDLQSRYIEGIVRDRLIGCLYLPNGNPAPGPKFDYKLRWFERLIDYADKPFATALPSYWRRL